MPLNAAAAAIDSTVLEAELARAPSLRRAFRRIDTLGPSPAPPWVVSTRLAPDLRNRIGLVLQSMGGDAQGAAILSGWGISELRRVDASHYDPMREMMRVAAL
jgi:phosphonate transport system substrate-binding protein